MAEQTVPHMAQAVESRRKELGLSPSDFAREAGLTVQGLAHVRKGTRRDYQDRVLNGVARALHWPNDWYQRILDGSDGTDLPHTEHAPKPSTIEDRVAALEGQITDLREAVGQIVRSVRKPAP